jgi:molybdopterin converting factor small subunit
VITVEIPAALQQYAAARSTVRLTQRVRTVHDALSELAAQHPGVVDRILTEQGDVREHINIFIDSENTRFQQGLATQVPDGSTLVILAAVSGG